MRDNTGSISKNKNKASEKHPDYKGSAQIGGTLYRVSAWKKDGTDGPWLSLAFDVREERAKDAAPSKAAADDDFPF